MAVPVKIVSLTKVSATTPTGQALRVELNNGRVLTNVRMNDIVTPAAFGALLAARGTDCVPVCAGTTTTEKQKYWNAELKPIVQAMTTAVPRWRDESYWKNAR
jgi:hypothetical protein